MIYTFFSSVFITLFLVTGTLALWHFIDKMRCSWPLSWTYYQHVVILAALAAICFIAACLFGAQIPGIYGTQF